MKKWASSSKLTLILVLALIALLLIVTRTDAQDIRNPPATIADAIGAEITGVLFYHRYERIESHDADLMAEIGAWALDVGFTPDWYVEAPVAGTPLEDLCIWTNGGSGRDPCDVFIWVYADQNAVAGAYPAMWTYERMFGGHADKDLHNHPDLGWWSMKRANLDALLAQFTA